MPAALRTWSRHGLPIGSRRPAGRGLTTRAVLLAAVCALGGCASTPGAETGDADAAAYRGSWAYAQACGLQHSARLDIDIAGDDRVRGEWSDGTRVAGESGRLVGRIREGRLDLRLCPSSGDCPPPSAPADSHLRREGAVLVWYRRFGGGSGSGGDASARDVRYLNLHQVVGDADPPLDTDCRDDTEPAR